MVMIRLNIHEAKTHLSRYLERLREGEVIIICKRNVPIAEIRGLPEVSVRERPIGLAKDELTVPESFYQSLSEDLLLDFEGDDE